MKAKWLWGVLIAAFALANNAVPAAATGVLAKPADVDNMAARSIFEAGNKDTVELWNNLTEKLTGLQIDAGQYSWDAFAQKLSGLAAASGDTNATAAANALIESLAKDPDRARQPNKVLVTIKNGQAVVTGISGIAKSADNATGNRAENFAAMSADFLSTQAQQADTTALATAAISAAVEHLNAAAQQTGVSPERQQAISEELGLLQNAQAAVSRIFEATPVAIDENNGMAGRNTGNAVVLLSEAFDAVRSAKTPEERQAALVQLGQLIAHETGIEGSESLHDVALDRDRLAFDGTTGQDGAVIAANRTVIQQALSSALQRQQNAAQASTAMAQAGEQLAKNAAGEISLPKSNAPGMNADENAAAVKNAAEQWRAQRLQEPGVTANEVPAVEAVAQALTEQRAAREQDFAGIAQQVIATAPQVIARSPEQVQTLLNAVEAATQNSTVRNLVIDAGLSQLIGNTDELTPQSEELIRVAAGSNLALTINLMAPQGMTPEVMTAFQNRAQKYAQMVNPTTKLTVAVVPFAEQPQDLVKGFTATENNVVFAVAENMVQTLTGMGFRAIGIGAGANALAVINPIQLLTQMMIAAVKAPADLARQLAVVAPVQISPMTNQRMIDGARVINTMLNQA